MSILNGLIVFDKLVVNLTQNGAGFLLVCHPLGVFAIVPDKTVRHAQVETQHLQ